MGFWDWFKKKETKTWEHFCVSNAIRDAWTYGVKTKRPVRIAVTKIKQGEDHAQAQGQNERGEWVFLTTHNNDGLLREWTSHYPDKEPYRYVNLGTWISENYLYTNQIIEG